MGGLVRAAPWTGQGRRVLTPAPSLSPILYSLLPDAPRQGSRVRRCWSHPQAPPLLAPHRDLLAGFTRCRYPVRLLPSSVSGFLYRTQAHHRGTCTACAYVSYRPRQGYLRYSPPLPRGPSASKCAGLHLGIRLASPFQARSATVTIWTYVGSSLTRPECAVQDLFPRSRVRDAAHSVCGLRGSHPAFASDPGCQPVRACLLSARRPSPCPIR
jgi:hypothetical protein